MTFHARLDFDVKNEREFEQIKEWFKTFKNTYLWSLKEEGTSIWDDYRNAS